MLGNAGEVFLVCLVALEGFLFKRPSVVGNVFLKLLKLGLETGSLGNENVVNKVVGIEDFLRILEEAYLFQCLGFLG